MIHGFNTMDLNHIIQSLWIGDSLIQTEQLCVNSYRSNDHKSRLYIYDQIKDIPTDVIINDTNENIPLSGIFFDLRVAITSFSDWSSYNLLFGKSGWCVDMDNICFKRYDFEQDYCFSGEGLNVLV